MRIGSLTDPPRFPRINGNSARSLSFGLLHQLNDALSLRVIHLTRTNDV
jgi:hypothetical protein